MISNVDALGRVGLATGASLDTGAEHVILRNRLLMCRRLALTVRETEFETKDIDPLQVAEGVAKALEVYGTPEFDEMIKACMKLNLSWEVRLRLL